MKVLFNNKRILSMFLAIVLAIGMIPSSTFAAIALDAQTSGDTSVLENSGTPENNTSHDWDSIGDELSDTKAESVAKVGNTEYATIDEAIANWTNGTTLTLLADVTLSDVIQLSSTEYHVLDLGTYTMTAASKKDAIQIVNNGRSSASYALDIKADATNPGGITATGKAVVKTTGKSGVKDRPIIRFYNGVFTGTNVVYHSGSNGTNCPQFQFHGGVFNGTVYANRALFQFYGGTFNGNLQISVDSSAYALISGGRFKKLSNQYGSTLNSDKFTIGSSKGKYDRGIYIDAEGYYVITSEVITDVSAEYPAAKKESYNSNNYFYYSAAATYGMFYEDADMAGTGDNVTIYEDPAVAQIGKDRYETFAGAIEAANAGDTITFLADITENVTISKKVTINGAGKTYTGKMTVTGNVEITITNVNFVKGSIDGNTSATGRKLTVNNCTFDGVDKSIGYAITVRHGVSLKIESCTATNYGTGMLYVPQSVTTITVKDVEVSNVAAAFNISYSGNSSFENIKLSNVTYGLHVQNRGARTFTLTGCEFNCEYPIYVQVKETATVTFDLVGENKFITETVYNSQYANLKLATGATLTAPEGLNIEIAEGMTLVYKNGVYTVIEFNPIVEVNGVQYASLAEALAAANAGDTITLLADITEDVTISKKVTIDGAGKTYTGKMTVTGNVEITITNVNFVKGCIDGNTSATGRKLTVNNCTFDGVDKSIGYAITVRHGVSLTIENCTATNYGTGMLYVPQSVTTITVKDVEVSNVAAAFNISYSSDSTFESVTLNNVTYGLHVQNHGARTFTLTGCEFNCEYPIYVQAKGTATVTFKFVGENIFVTETVYNSQYANLKLAVDATLTAPEGLTITTDTGYSVKYENGKYFVKANMVAIGDNTYASLTEALTAANAGDTITFLANINEDVTISKKVTINGKKSEAENFQYTGKMTISGNADVTIQNVNFVKGYIEHKGTTTSASLTVKGCSFTSGGYAITTERIKNLTIENCTVTGQSLLYAKLATSNIVVKNVTVSGGNYVAHIVHGTSAYFENVIATDMTGYGIFTQNHGSKTITIKNCSFDTPYYTSIGVNETRSDVLVDTFIFEGNNEMTSLENVFAAKYVLGTADATLTAPAGATVTTSAGEYVVKYISGTYTLVEAIAEIDGTYYETLQEAINAAQNGETVTLLKDLENLVWDGATKTDGKYPTIFYVTGKDITLDLNGKTISVTHTSTTERLYSIIGVSDGASLTVTGNGTIDVITDETTPKVAYLFLKLGTNGNLTIENGYYHMNHSEDSMAYSNGNKTIIVNGGTFILDTVGQGDNKDPWIFNTKGQNNYHVIVNGGTFNADVMHQYWEFEVQSAEGTYIACVAIGEDLWTVVPAKVLVGEQSTSSDGYTKWVGYATFAEAYAAAKAGETIKILVDGLTIDVDITNNVTILKDDITVAVAGKLYAGTYNWDVSEYVANGCCVKETDGMWNVHAHINAERHDNEYAPTCTADGYYELVVYCECCREEFSRTQVTISALGHTAGEVQIENRVEATCDSDGAYQKVTYCTVCDAEVKREHATIPALGHTAGEAKKENEVGATCTEKGYYEKIVHCSVCNEVLSREVVYTSDAHNHKITMSMDPATGFGIKFYFDACDSVGYINIGGTEIERADWTTVSEGYYYVEYNKISAKDFADAINVQLIGDKMVVAGIETSVEAYAKAELARKDITIAYAELLNAMLKYGAAAEAYLNEVESNKTVSGKIPYADAYDISGDYKHLADIAVSGQSLVTIKFLFDFRGVENVTIDKTMFTINSGIELKYEAVENKSKPGVWMVSVEVPAYYMSEAITCTANVEGHAVSVTYSVETYAFEAYLFEDLNYRCDLVDAMMAYGNAAKAFAPKN